MTQEYWVMLLVFASLAAAIIIRAATHQIVKPVTFGELEVGQRFFAVHKDEAHAWKKIAPVMAGAPNAITLGQMRFTARFSDAEQVKLPAPMQRPAFWRRWLLHRSLIWETYGHHRKARFAWRLGRVLSTDKTQQACAAYCGQLLMMGD